jgi:hypothetical protein
MSNLHESDLLFHSEILNFFDPSFLFLGELSVNPGFWSRLIVVLKLRGTNLERSDTFGLLNPLFAI